MHTVSSELMNNYCFYSSLYAVYPALKIIGKLQKTIETAVIVFKGDKISGEANLSLKNENPKYLQ